MGTVVVTCLKWIIGIIAALIIIGILYVAFQALVYGIACIVVEIGCFIERIFTKEDREKIR